MAPEESQGNESCDICENVVLFFNWGIHEPSKQEAHQLMHSLPRRLFHQACEHCSVSVPPNSDIAADRSICRFCQHLRLGHLLCCSEPDEWPMEDALIRFCELRDVSARAAACAFCRLILGVGLPYGYFSGLDPLSSPDEEFVSLRVQDAALQVRIHGPESWRAVGTIHFRGEWPRPAAMEEQPAITPGSTLRAYFNYELTANWLKDCYENHESCRSSASGALPRSFRVIDVSERCIVQSSSDCSFVALSYVWGQRPDPTKLFTITSNVDKLGTPGALSPSALPRTLDDAVEACRRLGERYLWADRLCIIQDSPADKAEQIAAMAAIYSRSKFTLIATDGDSDSGIAGVGRARTHYQPPLHLHSQVNLTFTAEPAGWRDVLLGSCVWSTRGWTYQESVLPRRKVYLTEAQAFFECLGHTVSETGSKTPAMYSSSMLRPQPWAPRYEAFNEHLARYRERRLTNDEDVYHAIEGVASALYSGRGALWYGLPREEFDETLLWCWSLEEEKAGKPIWNASTPSWSWSSTERGVGYLGDFVAPDCTYCETLVSWKRLVPAAASAESVRVIPGGQPLSHFRAEEAECGCQPREVAEETNEDDGDEREGIVDPDLQNLLFAAVAWSQGCIDRTHPFQQPGDTNWKTLRLGIGSRWACSHQYWQEAFQVPADLNDSVIAGLGTDILFASVQLGDFGLKPSARPPDGLGAWRSKLCITDSEGQTVGLLAARDGNVGVQDDKVSHGTFEFIALSVGKMENIVFADGTLKNVNEGEFQPRNDTSDSQVYEVDTSKTSQDDEWPQEAWSYSNEGEILQTTMDERAQRSSGPGDEPEGAVSLVSSPRADAPTPARVARNLVTDDSKTDRASEMSSKRSVRPPQDDDDWDRKELPSLDELRKLTFLDENGDCLFPIPVINVMMVVRESNGFARRASVGWIYLRSWVQAKPVFETIYLK